MHMKAIVYHQYGGPDNLSLADVPKPVPKDNEVLVKVYAASINSWDWDMIIGKPFLVKVLTGFSKPRKPIIGSDIAGIVELRGFCRICFRT
jgi:NADPH:quinone reductase-like Zn-dependent oxidoreductase